MNDRRKRFDHLLAALTERELTRWEREELWQILEISPEWIPDYVDHLQFSELVAALDPALLAAADVELPVDNLVALPPAPRPANPRPRRLPLAALALVGSAAAAVTLAVLVPEPAASRKDVPAPQADPALASYRRTVDTLPVGGSLSRPATSFTSTKDAAAPDFNEKVKPILSEYCWSCHGPGDQKADLRLDRAEDATADLGGYHAIVPGKAAESEAYLRMIATHPAEIMPPPESHKTMKPEEIEILRQWIDAGAEFREHWAFIAPAKPTPPVTEASGKWAANPIDHFVHARLAAAGLDPNPPATRRELARRAALDVTGLPPAPDLVERFVADSSPDAYERYLDELLASPHYGEHRTRFWLDAARYGDTHGMHLDNYREMWPWRDWVIRAFNDNLPFDRFVVEQLAGDLLPDPTPDQLVATGFNRNHITTSEDGSIPEEVATQYLIDRVETTSTVFLGLTAGCAACHDHKYDPISQKEFYQLGAFFNNTTQTPLDGNQKDTPPVLVLPDENLAPRWHQLVEERRGLAERLASLRETFADTPASSTDRPVPANGLVAFAPLEETEGPLTISLAGSPDAKLPRTPSLKPMRETPFDGGTLFTAKGGFRVPDALDFDAARPFTISFWIRPADEVQSSDLVEVVDPSNPNPPVLRLGVDTRSHLKARINVAEKDSIENASNAESLVMPSRWQHLVVRYSGGRSDSSIDFFIDGQRNAGTLGNDGLLEGSRRGRFDLVVGSKAITCGLARLRIFDRHLSDEEIQLLAHEPQLLGRGEPPSGLLTLHAAHQDAEYRQLSRQLEATEGERDFIAARSTTTLIMREKDTSPVAYVLDRGQYDQPRGLVSPEVPAALPPLPSGQPANRLGFARWLVSPNHPLTARVTVNRLWQSVFGTGLVKTAEDFGIMGEHPTHPALLDWLAVEFVESGWDTKHLLRLILTSATYRQSGAVAADSIRQAKFGIDPENRLLSRGPRIRLDAEVLRDQALAASGLLVPKIGGPSVKPYQPDGLWKTVAFDGSNTADFEQDHGDALYRRSLYTFWKRTSPPPSMAAFDAPTRESCTVRRERTNTPLQALVLLNDPQFVEAARHLAELSRSAAVPPASSPSFQSRLDFMMRRLLARSADPDESRILQTAFDKFQARFRENPESARLLIATGDSIPNPSHDPVGLASWTLLANLLLNRDDLITKP